VHDLSCRGDRKQKQAENNEALEGSRSRLPAGHQFHFQKSLLHWTKSGPIRKQHCRIFRDQAATNFGTKSGGRCEVAFSRT